MTCYFSSSDCSGNVQLLNNFAYSDVVIILTENGLHPTEFDISNASICSTHFCQFIRNNENLRKRKICQCPRNLSDHPGTTFKASRFLRLSEVEKIYENLGVIVPVGTPICTRCLMRVREVREHGEEHEADIKSVLGHNVQMHDAGQQDNSATGDFHPSQTTVSSSQGTSVEEIEMSSQGSYVEIDNLDRLNRFLIDVDLEPFSFPHSLWQTYTVKTKKKYFKGMQNMLERVAEILFGGDKNIVMKEFHQEVGNPDHNPVTYLPAESDITEALIESYKKASSWQIRRQILSVLSVSKSYQDIKVLLPGTTEYRFYAAKNHASLEGCCLPPPEKEDIRQRMDQAKLDNFLEFITSSHIVKDLPFGQKRIQTSRGKTIETPNIIRCMTPQAIITQYQQYCKEQEIEPLGTSTMFRILQNCTATIRKSLEGLDYYLAEGRRSFEALIDIVNELEKDEERAKHLQDVLLAAKRYLKTDYKIHVAETSDVADHCRRYALSDSSKLFSLECNHDHTNFCEACEQIKEVVGDVKQLVDNFDFSAREDKDDIIFRLKFAETGILGWKAHLLRSKNQEEAKQEVLRNLSSSNAYIILDWAMKYMPHKYREDSQDWFGKRGISWHIAVVFIKDEEILKALTYVHIFEGQICQDASVTTTVILDVIHGLRQEYPDISTINLWSDNAGCYKSSETISTLYHHCKTVNSFDFCEAQDGKGACDRSAAVIKANIRRFVNEGHDVVTARQMKQAIEKTSRKVKYRVKVVEVETTERQKFRPIPGISTLNNFKFLGERVQVWRQYGIGDGMTIPGKNLSNIQPTSLKILEGDSAEVHFHSILKPLSKEEQHVFTCSHESCVSTFSTSEELDHHLIVGSCDLKLEKERSNDLVVQKYAKILLKENREQYTLSCISKESTDDSILKKGWALKEERKCVRFSKKQESYLEDKFKAGLKSGRKEDPVSVSEEMRKLKNKDGERVFALEELLSAQQIAGFFSRMCKKSQSAIDESLFDSIHAIL